MECGKDELQKMDLNDLLVKLKSRKQFEEFFQEAGKIEYEKRLVLSGIPLLKQRLCFHSVQGRKEGSNI